MLPTARIDKPLKEVLDLLIVSHLGSLLNLLVEREQAGKELRVVGRLAYAQSMQQIERSFTSHPRLALR